MHGEIILPYGFVDDNTEADLSKFRIDDGVIMRTVFFSFFAHEKIETLMNGGGEFIGAVGFAATVIFPSNAFGESFAMDIFEF